MVFVSAIITQPQGVLIHAMSLHCADGLKARHQVARSVWPYMTSIAVVYFVTLCLFPGIESEIIGCRLGSWMPIVLMAVFNGFDFIGKVSTKHINKIPVIIAIIREFFYDRNMSLNNRRSLILAPVFSHSDFAECSRFKYSILVKALIKRSKYAV